MNFKNVALFLLVGVTTVTAFAQDLPTPKLRFVGVTEQVNNGVAVRGYEVRVVNREEFDNYLFISAPVLPPCGRNENASRTWVNIYDGSGRHLYGWCAIYANSELASLRFLIEASKPQPKKLFIDLFDRYENRTTRSNTVTVE